MKNVLRILNPLLGAALLTGATASILQTQVNIWELTRLQVAVPWATRLLLTLEDLLRFAPVMSGLAVAGVVPALAVARCATGAMAQAQRLAVYAFAAVLGLYGVFMVLPLVTPMASLVSATRGGGGLILLSLAAVPGGLLYGHLTRARAGSADHAPPPLRQGIALVALLVIPGALFLLTAPPRARDVPAADASRFVVQTVASGLVRPWSVAVLPDGRRLVTETQGRLRAIAPTGAVSDIRMDGFPPIYSSGGTIGLMDVVADPGFAANALLYFTTGFGERTANGTRLVRARLVGDALQDVRVLFSSTLKFGNGNNGGRLAFLRDGTIVLTVGDGSSRREEAQNLATHQGTVVRIDREGRAPADNPFFGRAGAAPEVYSLGHRNPQGIAVDPRTGDLLVTEHGPRGGDEVNRVRAGANYGWPILTGGIDYSFARVSPFRRLAGFEDPVLEWTPSIAPAGLAVYDGDLFPHWRGSWLVPALKERSVRRVIRDGRGRIVGQERLLADLGERMRDVKVAPDGSVYVLTDGPQGRLLRLVPAPSGDASRS